MNFKNSLKKDYRNTLFHKISIKTFFYERYRERERERERERGGKPEEEKVRKRE